MNIYMQNEREQHKSNFEKCFWVLTQGSILNKVPFASYAHLGRKYIIFLKKSDFSKDPCLQERLKQDSIKLWTLGKYFA